MKTKQDKETVNRLEEMTDEERTRGKKRFFAGIGLCCLALVFLILAVVFQDSSLPWLLYVFAAGMLAAAAAGLTLLINNLSCMLYGEAGELPRLIEVGASCFNHHGYCHTQRAVFP